VGTRTARTSRCRTLVVTVAVAVVAIAVAATGVVATPAAHAAKLDQVTIGYSAWPGWFPLAVAEKQGIFEKNGLDVDLKYFSDYIASLDAMAAGKLDGNAQTLNDTMAAVAGGSKQAIIVVNDNSAGNDAIICDQSVKSIADLKGKTIAAEEGVVDHFLLLQGLATEKLTQKDIDFRGVVTADAASSTASACSRPSPSRRSSGRVRTLSSARSSSPGSSPTTSWCRSRWWRRSRRSRRRSSTPGTTPSTT
jgi:NitT/TauT family transport system substrate-binding protein